MFSTGKQRQGEHRERVFSELQIGFKLPACTCVHQLLKEI
jgi:hypothetical protein